MNDDPILATLQKKFFIWRPYLLRWSLKLTKLLEIIFSNKCKLLQQQTVQIKENELKLDLKPL
jgi:hypothetical protein